MAAACMGAFCASTSAQAARWLSPAWAPLSDELTRWWSAATVARPNLRVMLAGAPRSIQAAAAWLEQIGQVGLSRVNRSSG